MANTYIEIGTHRTITHSRDDFNNTTRTIVTNFTNSSNTTPTSFNFTTDTTNINVPNGVLFASENTIYINSSDFSRNTRLGGSWTRQGLSPRVENGYTAMLANVANIEVGTLVSTISTNPSLRGAASLYLKINNTNSVGSLVDLGSTTLAPGVVTTITIIDSAITRDAFFLKAVTRSKLADDCFTNAKIADDAVDTPQIADDAVENAQIADDAVDTPQIADDAVENAQIADDAVDTPQIADDAVENAQIANEAVQNENIPR